MVEKTSMRKNLTSGINEKKPPKPKRDWRRKLGKSVDKKPPNPEGTVEENRKIFDALMLLAPGGTLRTSGMRW